MAGVIKIEFKVGGADVVARMLANITKAAEQAGRAAVRIERKANQERMQDVNASARQRVAIETAAQRQLDRLAVASHRSELAMMRDRAREATRLSNEEKRRDEATMAARRRALSGVVGGVASGAAGGVRTLGRGVGAVVRGGMGLAGSLMSGAGVEFGLGRAIRGRAELEKRAIDLSNSGYQENGKGVQTQRIDPKTLMQEASAVGKASALDPSQAIEGVAGFTKVTGDLATGRALMPEAAKFARATGSSLAETVAAAGEISKAMGDAATTEGEARARADAVMQVMKGVAGQGKLGSIEMSDWAKGGARYAAAAQQFEGNAGSNMLKVGMLGQEARGGGGAWNPATAAAAVSGLVTTFTTPSRKKAFDSLGINLKGEGGKLRDPVAIISEAIDKTGGDINKLQPMFANVVGARAMRGLSNKYLEGSGGRTDEKSKAAGRAKMQEEIDRLTKGAVMSDKDINDSNAASMNSLEAKAQIFQQRLDQIAGDLADKLMPAFLKLTPALENMVPVVGKFIDSVTPHADELASALVRLAPVAGKAADALATLITFAVDHPVLAGGAVVGGSALQGGASALLGAAAQGLLGSSTTLGTAGTSMIASAGQLGAAAALLAGIHFGGRKVIDKAFEEVDTLSGNQGEATNLASKLRRGKGTAEDKKEAEGMAGRFELMGGNFFERFAGANNETLDRVSKDGATPESLLRLIASPVTSALTAGTTGSDAAKGGANDAAQELRQALSEATKMPDAAAMGTAMAGPVGEAVERGVKSGLAGAGIQNPKASPPPGQ